MAVSRDEFRRFSRPVLRTKRWKVLRLEILERDGFKCRSCGSPRRLEVDHVKPVRNAPHLSFDKANLQTLCAACHTRKTRIECGHPEITPERRAWSAALKAVPSTPATGENHAG